MVYFQPKIPIWINIGGPRNGKSLVYLIWNILLPFGIIYGRSVQFLDIWYIFPNLVCLNQEKSGNPDLNGLFFFARMLRKCRPGQST
jgi:hypothetical protein